MKSLKSLKEQFLAKTPLRDPTYTAERSIDELLSIWGFLDNPSDENYVKVVVEKFKSERKRLTEAAVPVAEWPEELAPDDWEARVWEGFGMSKETKAVVSQNNA